MELTLHPHFARIIDEMEPFIISYPGNWPALDLAPWGLEVSGERRYTATRLSSRDVVDGLHRLDGFGFGPQEMLMPRWVLFDCGEFPGLVFGFGALAGTLPEAVRVAYAVNDREDDPFVPLSMWVAIRCAEEGAWFGHNLSSANIIPGASPWRGLGTLTKVFGIRVTRAVRQYGATQWDSTSAGIHVKLGELELCSAWTPAHTHPESFSYRLDVDEGRLAAVLGPEYRRVGNEGREDRMLMADDHLGMEALQMDLESGQRWAITSLSIENGVQRFVLRRA